MQDLIGVLRGLSESQHLISRLLLDKTVLMHMLITFENISLSINLTFLSNSAMLVAPTKPNPLFINHQEESINNFSITIFHQWTVQVLYMQIFRNFDPLHPPL